MPEKSTEAVPEVSDVEIAAVTAGLIMTLSVVVTGMIFAGVSFFVYLKFLRRAKQGKYGRSDRSPVI